MLCFNAILSSNFVLFCFKLTSIHYFTQKREKLNLNRNKIKPQHVNKFISRPVYEM